MTKAEKIKYSVLGLLAVSVIILGISLFTAYKSKGNDYFKEAIEAKDESINILKNSVKILEKVYDQSNTREDSLFKRLAQIETNMQRSQQIYKSFENRLQNIPASIARIAGNDDSIRAEYQRFK